MKLIIIISLLLTVSLSCGRNSPFDERYWDQPQASSDQDVTQQETMSFTTDLAALPGNLGNINGTVTIIIDQVDVTSSIKLAEMPESLMVAGKSITSLTCEQIALNNPLPEIPNHTAEFKEISLTEEGTREALVADLNQNDPQNGNSVDLTGKRYVIKALVSNVNSPIPQNTAVIPIACGTIVRSSSDGQTTGGTTVGGTTVGGTTVGGTTVGGTIGGTIGGGTGGVDGSIGGGTDGTFGGAIGGTTGF